MVAAPQPPSLKLPEPVTDLAAQRTGDVVTLHWTMPKRATDKVMLVEDQRAEVCRHLNGGRCDIAANLLLAPQSAADFTDHLSGALASGPLRPLTYTVELENHAGQSAGPSNAAATAAGAAPAQVADLRAQAQADGKLVEKAGAAKSRTPPREQAPEQTLEFTGQDEGTVLDRNAALDHTYTYTVQRIAKLALEGKSVEVASAPSESITIDARDVFPPAVPQGLQTVADAEGRAIDLSWQPDTEADLAGYSVYRREAGSNTPPVRISAQGQTAPSFRDVTAQPGHRYEYSVSAIDHDGNESQRSAEVEESLPQQ
jgi:Fibronectin type III domain